MADFRCNNCGHGPKHPPDRKCNCNCHPIYEAAFREAIEDAAKVAETCRVSSVSPIHDIAAEIRKLLGCRTEQPAPKCEECDIEMDLVGTIDRHDGQTWHCSQCGWSWP